MKKNKVTEIDLDTQRKYDEICGLLYVNIYSASKNSKVICLAPYFNYKNKEHLLVAAMAKGVGSVEGKGVVVATNYFGLRALNKGVIQECRFRKFDHKKDNALLSEAIDVEDLLMFIHPYIQETYGITSLAPIYDAFFAKKG